MIIPVIRREASKPGLSDNGTRYSAASIDKPDAENTRKPNLPLTANTVSNFGYKDVRSKGTGSTSKLVVRSVANQGTMTNYFKAKKTGPTSYLSDFKVLATTNPVDSQVKTALSQPRTKPGADTRPIASECPGEEIIRLHIKGLPTNQSSEVYRRPLMKALEGDTAQPTQDTGYRGRGGQDNSGGAHRKLQQHIIQKALERASLKGVTPVKDRDCRVDTQVRPRLCLGPTLRSVKYPPSSHLHAQISKNSGKKRPSN